MLIFKCVDGLIYPLVQNVYRTDLFNVDGLIYPLVQNVYPLVQKNRSL